MRRIPTAVFLLVILGVLVAVAALQSASLAAPRTAPTATADPRDVQTVFRHITPEVIHALRIDDPRSERDLILENDGQGSWRLVGVPNPTALDPVVAANIAKTVAFIPYVQILPPEDARDLAHFGLTSETFWLQIQVILTTMETRNIVVGHLVPGSRDGYYALVDERAEVYVLNRGAVDYLAVYLRQVQPFVTA